MADTTTNLGQMPPQGFEGSLDGTIVTVINGDLGNANTSYSYFDLLRSGLNMFSLQFTIQNTTLTIEASNDAPTVANGSATWTDITDVLTSGVASSFTATGSLTVMFPVPWSRFRIKRVTTNATNALTIKMSRGNLA